MPMYRFDLAGLTPEEIEELETRLNMVAFMLISDPLGRFFDLHTERQIDPAALISDFKKIKFIEYSHVPADLWRYPFA